MEADNRRDVDIEMSRPVATGRDIEYTIPVQEAASMFAARGLPRTERAIQRYCKNGDLECAPVDTAYGTKYLITHASLERLILQKQQAQQHAPRPSGDDRSRQDAEWADGRVTEKIQLNQRIVEKAGPDTSDDNGARQAPTPDDAAQAIIKKLQDENFGLKVDVAGKQTAINYLVAERDKLLTATQDLSYRLGAAETRVAQLEAPPRETSFDGENANHLSVGEGSVIFEMESQPASAMTVPTAAPSPPAPEQKRSLFGRIFGPS